MIIFIIKVQIYYFLYYEKVVYFAAKFNWLNSVITTRLIQRENAQRQWKKSSVKLCDSKNHKIVEKSSINITLLITQC